jgi:hypothetical protein
MAESPRGGNHLYFTYCEGITVDSSVFPAIDIRGEGGYIVAPPSINGTGKPYKWIVGLEQNRAALPASFLASYNNINNSKTNYIRNCLQPVSSNLTGAYGAYRCLHEGNRNSDIFTISTALVRGGLDPDMSRQVIEILANNCTPPYDLKEANESLKSAFDRKNKRERNIHEEIREYILQQKCLHETYISLTSCLQSLQLLTRQEKSAAYVSFNRFCNTEKLIEKHGDKRGEYRIVDNEKSKAKMDLIEEPVVNEVNVKLPLDLNRKCILSPGNIIVISGSKSSGKTAILMNIAWMNQDRFEVHYLNSEMHETEFKKRMKKFAPLNKWHIHGFKCHSNFAEFIESDPKKIYIIDFMEIHDNFYEIGKHIRAIHEKLGDSVCFIALQMKSGASLGRGAEFSAEKARLYLTMDFIPEEILTKVTIYDAKEPRPPEENVRGLFKKIKIIEGNQLRETGNWDRITRLSGDNDGRNKQSSWKNW